MKNGEYQKILKSKKPYLILIIMKKVFVIASVGMLLFASCKKDYTCTYSYTGEPDTVVNYTKLSKTAATAAESVCTLGAGKWSKK
ncbi:MAG: hypothetical protein WC044_10440 [Crocinitomicaceae bacterium]